MSKLDRLFMQIYIHTPQFYEHEQIAIETLPLLSTRQTTIKYNPSYFFSKFTVEMCIFSVINSIIHNLFPSQRKIIKAASKSVDNCNRLQIPFPNYK